MSKSKKGNTFQGIDGLVCFISVCITFSHMSIRNLFAIDYLKEHPDTTAADFKVVFDALDDTTKKVFHVFTSDDELTPSF